MIADERATIEATAQIAAQIPGYITESGERAHLHAIFVYFANQVARFC